MCPRYACIDDEASDRVTSQLCNPHGCAPRTGLHYAGRSGECGGGTDQPEAGDKGLPAPIPSFPSFQLAGQSRQDTNLNLHHIYLEGALAWARSTHRPWNYPPIHWTHSYFLCAQGDGYSGEEILTSILLWALFVEKDLISKYQACLWLNISK